MSIEDLKADLATNIREAKGLTASMTTAADVMRHMTGTVWPFLENLVGELEEVDGTVDDMYHNAEDILQTETGQLFATVVAGAMALVGELEQRLGHPADAGIIAGIREWRRLAMEAAEVISEITLPAPADDKEEEEEDEDYPNAEDDQDQETEQPEAPNV